MSANEQKGSRLRRAREMAGYKSAEAACERFCWAPHTYRHHERGSRPYDDKWAAEYGKAYKTPPEWLLFARNAPRWAWVPVVSHVGAGATVIPENAPFDFVEPPPGASEDAFALIVRGNSMLPAMSDGDLLICEWRDDPLALINRLAVIDLEDGRRFVKRLIRGSEPKSFTLVGMDASLISNVHITRAAEIVWHKFS